MAYTKYSLTPADNNAAPPNGAPEGMLPSAVNDTMRDMMSQIRDVGDGIRGGTYTMTAPVITGGSITGVALSGNTLTNPVITGGSINNTTVGATTANTGAFTTLTASSTATLNTLVSSGATLTGGSINNTTVGATTANTGKFTTLEATGATTFSGAVVMSASVTANTFSSSGATITGGSINGATVGATTRATGAFTTLASNGATTFTAGTASTSTTTGTAVITGGLGVSGRINAANFDGIVGANTAAAGNFTTLGATGVATFSAGTVSAPAITTTGDTNTGIFFPAADTIAFTEGGVESMRIDSDGDVGIGTTTPNAKLTVRRSGAGLLINGDDGTVTTFIADTTGSVLTYGTFSNHPVAFKTDNGERMRIDSSGNVGIGTTSPDALLSVNGIASFGDGAAATPSIANFGDLNTGFWFPAADTIAASTAGSERMRLDSSGNLMIGTSSAASLPSDGYVFIKSTSTQYIGHASGTASGTGYLQFWLAGVSIGSITQSGTTAVLYNTSSDARLKANVVDAPSANIADIKVRSFDWIADGSHQTYGMVAQELLEVAPYAVSKSENPEEMMGVDYSKLVPMMVKAIQEQQTFIENLTTRLNALEGK